MFSIADISQVDYPSIEVNDGSERATSSAYFRTKDPILHADTLRAQIRAHVSQVPAIFPYKKYRNTHGLSTATQSLEDA